MKKTLLVIALLTGMVASAQTHRTMTVIKVDDPFLQTISTPVYNNFKPFYHDPIKDRYKDYHVTSSDFIFNDKTDEHSEFLWIDVQRFDLYELQSDGTWFLLDDGVSSMDIKIGMYTKNKCRIVPIKD
jgi:hypothetical protein